MMINSFDINPLAHEMHLKELDRTYARHINRDDRVPTFGTVYPKTELSECGAREGRAPNAALAHANGRAQER